MVAAGGEALQKFKADRAGRAGFFIFLSEGGREKGRGREEGGGGGRGG